MSMMRMKESQAGFSMIELVVAMFVFAIGLLGFAALQTRTLQEGLDSTQRSTAIWSAQEMADRIRANPTELNIYVNALNNANLCDAAPATRCADHYAGSHTAAASCTATEMANFDAWEVMCHGDNAPDNAVIDSTVELNCTDSDTSDGNPCSEGSRLQLEMTWTSKAADSDTEIADDADAITQRYLLNFQP